MYSLYRAWLSLGPSAGLQSALPTLSPSDLQASSSSSFGYASQHSNGSPDVTLQVGPNMTHFSAHKNILSAHSGFFKAVLLNHTGTNPIAVPNINVDEFSSLLTFMYTGFLDLNYSNIYNILLATHILHMPRALEICRSFLIQNHPLEARPNVANIIKPIPSRKSILPHQQIFPPLFGNLQKSEGTPFRTIGTQEKPSKTITSNECETIIAKPQKLQEQKKITTTTTVLLSEKIKLKKREEGNGGGPSGSEKVVVDVACCDGPVRFHRVFNKNYGLKTLEGDFQIMEQQVDRNVLLNKVMNQNIREKQSENENLTAGAGTAGGTDMFTCVYCNHTFKSQYCYQKHARRHLNPVNLEVKSIQKIENVVSSKREVKLLDMNVQYYPCKTCGSKFPSYYFVHKHRKMCHADEVGGDGNSVKSMEIGEKSNHNNSNNDNSNNIDDEAKNNNEESEIEVENDN